MSEDDFFDPRALIKKVRQSMSGVEARKKYRIIDHYDFDFWYPTQRAFFASTALEKIITSGNQRGKSLCAGANMSWDLTGSYPRWWTGYRTKKPIRAWAIGETSQLTRDALQRKLCGPRNDMGTGLIPLETYARPPVMIPGGSGGVDTLFITHETDGRPDGTSELSFRSYEQGRAKLASESVDLIWCDENPADESLYAELQARTFATKGRIMVSFTAIGELGATGLAYKLLNEPSPNRAVFWISEEEAVHINTARSAEIADSLPENEVETRLRGTPALGLGPIFPLELLPSMTQLLDPDSLPPWTRWCVGVDFGFAHEFAGVMIAWDPQGNRIWIIDSFGMPRTTPREHRDRIHSMTGGLKLPIAYPHDGGVHGKGDGLVLKDQYRNEGLNMMASHAVNHGTKMNNGEPALEEIREFMINGRMTINSPNTELIQQIRRYHRDQDHRIVKAFDDRIDAMRYAIMMRRFGKPRSECAGVGFGTAPYAYQQPGRSSTQPRFASGIEFPLFGD
jgi:phage terminase large subunit-like protein